MADAIRTKPVTAGGGGAQSAAETARRALDASPAFATLREQNGAAALASLFEGTALPGGTARERLDQVLAYTASDNMMHFRVEFTDRGFQPDLRDSQLYDAGRSNQVGHFLTAVKLGLNSNYLTKAAAVGHELTGDPTQAKGFKRKLELFEMAGLQVAKGMTSPGKLKQFDEAVKLARAGDRDGAKRVVEKILPDMPWSHEPWNGKDDRTGRLGNSRQDMLLTAYGFALSGKVRDGELKTPADVNQWMKANLIEAPPATATAATGWKPR